ncbi:MAG: NADP-dependent malic enzyme [Clostridiales bacterium]|nr:NADP-dependent malic enzyme [Clostridiales bacterium]
MDYAKLSLELSAKHQGKLNVTSDISVTNKDELSIAYSPGVAEPCKKIHENPHDAYQYTIKGRTVAVISDGSAVLGLGNIGPEAAMPVMEGKCLLFKSFGGVDAFPLCLDTQDTQELIRTITYLAPTFGGINLEDISAPRCFEIEEALKKTLDIPVFHDDQHGTAIVVLAGLINSLKVVHKKWEDLRIVINGPGAAGISIAKLLLQMNPKDLVMVGLEGALYDGKPNMNTAQQAISQVTNKEKITGSLAETMKGADVLIGVSAPNIVTAQMVSTMNQQAIVFALANPVPEIMPEEAKKGGAAIIATGRSDYPNQINNVLVFPGIFKGALMVEAKTITEEMKLAAAKAIASILAEEELSAEQIIPNPFDPRVAQVVADQVATVAEKAGIARKPRG